MIRPKPLFRALAAVLCFQPWFFHSGVVLAQNVERSETSTIFPQDGDQQQFSLPGDQGTPRLAKPAPITGQPTAPETLTRPLPPVDEPVDPDAYILGPGDVLELNFWGLQNFRLSATIDLEGRAFVPRVGYFDLKGKDLSEARRMLRTAVAGLYPRLSFDLTLAEPRTFQVQVVGAVERPASYSSRATERAATLIQRAGGFLPNASRRRVEIKHRDGKVDRADLLLFALTGDNRFNPHVLDGDAIRVQFEELAVTISGGVNRPGRYELIDTQDLGELVEVAGGLAPDATTDLPVSVDRWASDAHQVQLLIPFVEAGVPAAKLRKQDVVRVPTTAELSRSVYVVGAVIGAQLAARATTGAATPGAETTTPDEASSTRRLPFLSGETVRGLLVRLGGVGPLADLRRSYIVREGAVVVPVDLERLITLRDLSADQEILLGDTLVIPFKRTNILVEGSVFAPGSYPYNPTYGIDQYISLAGGPNRNARAIEEMHVVTATGQLKAYDKNLVIEPGSSLVVPERNFSRAELVTIALGIASVLVSGVAVLITATK